MHRPAYVLTRTVPAYLYHFELNLQSLRRGFSHQTIGQLFRAFSLKGLDTMVCRKRGSFS